MTSPKRSSREAWFLVMLAALVLTMCGAPKPSVPAAVGATPSPSATIAANRAVSAPIDLAPALAPHPEAPPQFRRDRASLTMTSKTLDARIADDGAIALTSHGRPGSNASFHLATTSVRRGATTLVRPGHATLDGAHAQIARGDVTEQVTASSDGLEQAWTLASRPRGEGDLELRVAASGGEYAGKTARGHHLRDPKSHLGLRYGDATWTDAAGRRAEIAVGYEGGAFVVRVPASLLDAASYPATIDPEISAEIDVDQTGDVPISAGQPGIAYDGTNLLYVWSDRRNDEFPSVYGLRVNPQTLQPLAADGYGFLISGSNSAQSPVVTYDGTNFVVVWRGVTPAMPNGGFYAARVTSSGTVLASDVDGVSLGIAAPAYSATLGGVAYDGTNDYLVWSFDSTLPEFAYGARLDPSTLKPRAGDEQGVALLSEDEYVYTPHVFAAGGYDIVETDSVTNSPTFRRIDPATGAVVGAQIAPFSCTSCGGNTSVAYDGTNYLVILDGPGKLSYARVSAATWSVLPADSGGRTIAPPPNTDLDYFELDDPAVTYDGTNFVVAYTGIDYPNCNSDCDAIFEEETALIDPATGTVRASNVIDTQTSGGPSLIVRAGAETVLAWSSGPTKIATIGTTGAVSGTTTSIVAAAPSAEFTPGVAFDGTNYAVAWRDSRGGAYIARVSPTAQAELPSDGSGVPIASYIAAASLPSLSYGGGEYLLATFSGSLGEYGNTYVASGTGQLTGIDPNTLTSQHSFAIPNSNTPIPVLGYNESVNTTYAPSVTYGAGEFLAVWLVDGAVLSARVNPTTNAFFAADGNGQTVSGSATTNLAAPNSGPVAAFDGTNFVVVWKQSVATAGGGTANYLYGARIDPTTGKVLPSDTAGVALSRSVSTLAPSVACAGTSCLAVWADYESDLANGDIYAARIDTSGATLNVPTLGHDLVVSNAIGDQTYPKVIDAEDGLNFQVVWQDRRSGTSYDIYGALVTHAGAVQDSGGIAISADPANDELAPALAAQGNGAMLVAYSHFDPSNAFVNTRARARFFSTGIASGASACTTNDDCATRLCVDGYCCATACNGACETCAATPGTCTPITSGDDPDTCSAALNQSTCTASGTCGLRNGFGAGSGAACASGFASSGVCCDSACQGGCGTCVAPGHVGTCTPLAKGSTGSPSCVADGGGVFCDGQGLTCPGTCASDADCANTSFCNANGSCAPRVAETGACNLEDDCKVKGTCSECLLATNQCGVQTCANGTVTVAVTTTGAGTCLPSSTLGVTSCGGLVCEGNACKDKCGADTDCVTGATCNQGTHKCESGATCVDTHTLQDINGTKTPCDPYVCVGGACTQHCVNVGDCTNGYICNANGACVVPSTSPSTTSSGCSCRIGAPTTSDAGLLAVAGVVLAIRRPRRRGHGSSVPPRSIHAPPGPPEYL